MRTPNVELRHQRLQPKHRPSASSPVKTHNSHSKLFQHWIILCSCIKVPYPSHTWVMGHHSTITRVFLPSSLADLAVGLSNRWFFKPGLKTFNSPFHLMQRRSLTFNNIMNGYLQHDWWVWVPYIVTLGVRLFESYGKKSWILVDFLVDPIVHTWPYIHKYICSI